MNKCKRCKYIPGDFIDEITYNKTKGYLLPVIHYNKVCKICDNYDNFHQIINKNNDKYSLLQVINKIYNNDENKKNFNEGHTSLISNGSIKVYDNEPYNPYKYGYYDYSDRGFNWCPVDELYR